MLCDRCGNSDATVYVKQIINGKESYEHLCQDCAGGLFNVGSLQLEKLFSNLGFSDTVKEIVCPCCGSTFSDFKEKGRLGCSECYSTFAGRLEPTIQSIHGKNRHLGKLKLPKAGAELLSPQLYKVMDKEMENQNYEKLALQKQLDELVKAENFEQAALVRDKIKALEAKLQLEMKEKLKAGQENQA